MRKTINYFLQGLLYIAPIGITAYIIYVAFTFIDGLLKSFLDKILHVHIPGLGLVVFFFFLVMVGIVGQSILAKPIKVLFNRMIERAPLLKLIYTTMKDLFSAFVGKDRKFNKPVMVLVNPVSNLEKLGFLTEDDLSTLEVKDKVAVYFPHSYAFSGELFIVPTNQVRVLDINPAKLMKFVVSGGVSGLNDEPEPSKETIDKINETK